MSIATGMTASSLGGFASGQWIDDFRQSARRRGSTRPTVVGMRGHRFWILLASATASSLADGSFKVVLPLAARGLTDSPALIAAVSFAATLPWLLCALPAGAFVDRGDRKRIMAGADLVRGVLLALLALLSVIGLGLLPVLVAVAFLAGTAETFYATSASALVPAIVAPALLRRANSVQQVADQAADQLAGPALGGLLVAAGTAAAFAASSGIWLIAAGAALVLRGAFRTPVLQPPRSRLRADMLTGIRFVWSSRVLRSLCLSVGVTNFAAAATMAIFVVYAVGPHSAMGLSPSRYGLLLSVAAAGSIVGVLLVGPVSRVLGDRGLLAANVLLQTVQIGVPAMTSAAVPIAAGFFAGGIGVALWNVGTVSLRQRLAPPHLLGRVISSHRLVGWGALSLGALCGGLLAEVLAVRVVFALMAVVTLSAAGWAGAWSKAAIDAEGSHYDV
jgi:MFS family permease